MTTSPAMPGTDRDRALALGVMMCLQRERHWHFTMSLPQAWFWSTITLGIRPIWTLTKRFERYREHERMLLQHFCDALELHIARQDVRVLREALSVAVPVFSTQRRLVLALTPALVIAVALWTAAAFSWPAYLASWGLALSVWALCVIKFGRQALTLGRAMRLHGESMVDFVQAFNSIAHHYELRSIEAGDVHRKSNPRTAELFASLVPPWNMIAIECEVEFRRYVETTSLRLRTELAQRLAELRWTPIEADDDGVTRVD